MRISNFFVLILILCTGSCFPTCNLDSGMDRPNRMGSFPAQMKRLRTPGHSPPMANEQMKSSALHGWPQLLYWACSNHPDVALWGHPTWQAGLLCLFQWSSSPPYLIHWRFSPCLQRGRQGMQERRGNEQGCWDKAAWVPKAELCAHPGHLNNLTLWLMPLEGGQGRWLFIWELGVKCLPPWDNNQQ